MTVYHGAAKYIMKSAATFIEPNEHWYEILAADMSQLATVCMTVDQAEASISKMGLKALSPAQYLSYKQ